MAVCLLVWLLKEGYALGCNFFAGILIGVRYLSDSSEVEEVTIATFDCATWNNQ